MQYNYFDFAKGMKNSTSLCTRQTFESAIDSPEVVATIDKIAEVGVEWRKKTGKTQFAEMTQDELREYKQLIKPLKESLPVIMPHAHFTDGHRHQQSAVQSPFCSADFDGLDAPIAVWHEKVRPHISELHVALAFISPSGHGLKVIFTRVEGMTNEQCQLWFSKMVGIDKYDSTADLARAAFLTKRSCLLHYDPSLLFADEVQLTPATPQYMEMVGAAAVPTTETQTVTTTEEVANVPAVIPTYKGIQLTAIRDALLERWNVGADGPKVGERNNVVFSLARELASLDSSPEVLAAVIPHYTMDDAEWQETIKQATKYCSHGRPSRELTQVLVDLEPDETEEDDAYILDPQKEIKTPRNLPRFFKLVLRRYPTYQHPAIIASMLPICSTLATRARVMGEDGILQHLETQVCVVGEWGSGKDCTSQVYERLMRKIKEEDDANRALEDEWVEHCQIAASDKDRPRRPHNPIRMITASTTRVKLLERMKDAKGKHCILQTSEIEELVNSGQLCYSKTEPILRLSFDRDGGYVGNDSCSAQSANMNMKSRLNFLVAGTDDAVHRYFKSPEGGGPSRVLFVVIPNRLGMPKPKYKAYTEEEEAEIDRFIDLLMAEDDEEHPYHLPRVEKALTAWQKKYNKEFINKQADKARLKLTYRAYDIGLRAGCIAYLLEGKVESDTVVAFARYIANLVVYGGYALFADKMNAESSNAHQSEVNMRAYATPVKDLLSNLSGTFTKEQLINLRRQQGAENPANVRSIISRWRQGGYVADIPGEKGKFRKLKDV